MDNIYSVSETAKILQVSEESIRRYIKSGSLRASKLGKAYRIQEKDLQAFLESRIKEVEPEK